MKVLQVLPELNSGGVERGTLELGRYLAEKGHESLVVSHGGRLVEQLEREGSRHLTLPVHRKSPASLLQVRPFRRLLLTEKPDILHIRSRVPGWIAYLAWRKLPPGERPRLISTVHGFNSVNRYSSIMTRGEHVIAVSHAIREFILQHYPQTAPERVHVIHRGVDLALYNREFRPGEAWRENWFRAFPETKGKLLLTLPGRITRLKGHEDFLRMLASLESPDYHGIIAGGAHSGKQEYLGEIKSLAHSLGLASRVTFTGHRADLKEILSISTVVFSLSQKPESFGRTTLEALALGTPVIGYDHGGVGEILRVCFPAGLADKAAGTISPARIEQVRHSPLEPVTQFSLHQMLEKTLGLYEQVLRET